MYIARAIQHIHSKDLVHGDLKPHNIVRSSMGTGYRLIDFDASVVCTGKGLVDVDSDGDRDRNCRYFLMVVDAHRYLFTSSLPPSLLLHISYPSLSSLLPPSLHPSPTLSIQVPEPFVD